jgi:hypothetical protein
MTGTRPARIRPSPSRATRSKDGRARARVADPQPRLPQSQSEWEGGGPTSASSLAGRPSRRRALARIELAPAPPSARDQSRRPRRSRDSSCPEAAVRAVPARLLLSCLLFRSSWLTMEGDRHFGAAAVLRRRGGRAAVAVRVGVAGRVPERKGYSARSGLLLCRRQAGTIGGPVGPSLAAPRRP